MRLGSFLVIGACASPSAQPSPITNRGGDSPPVIERRCLPVVAKDCGCVYACGLGERDNDHWRVHHAFWKGAELRAVIERWCVRGACTDVFAAEIVCDGICAPKPADSTCHLDGADDCVGAAP